MVERNFTTPLKTNVCENSVLNAETSRAITSKTSSQMSRKLEELKSNLKSHTVDMINSALEEKQMASIKNAIEDQNFAMTTNLYLRSDGLRLSNFSQIRPQGTLGQMDCIRKRLAKRIMMLRRISPD